MDVRENRSPRRAIRQVVMALLFVASACAVIAPIALFTWPSQVNPERPMFAYWDDHHWGHWEQYPEYRDRSGVRLIADEELNLIAVLAVRDTTAEYLPGSLQYERAALWPGKYVTHMSRTVNLLRWVDTKTQADVRIETGVASSVIAALRSDAPDIFTALLSNYRGPDRELLASLIDAVDSPR